MNSSEDKNKLISNHYKVDFADKINLLQFKTQIQTMKVICKVMFGGFTT